MSIAFESTAFESVESDDGHVRGAAGLYFVGGLSDDEAVRVERHLAKCRSCVAEYEALGDAVFCLDRLGPADADELLAEARRADDRVNQVTTVRADQTNIQRRPVRFFIVGRRSGSRPGPATPSAGRAGRNRSAT
jgi:anti-sigma factor RsiW